MSNYIPKTLDSPIRCLGIPIDSLLVFMMVWSVFVLFDLGLYGLFTGIISAFGFARFRSRSIIRKIIRFIYWYLPAEMHFIKGIQGHQRTFCLKSIVPHHITTTTNTNLNIDANFISKLDSASNLGSNSGSSINNQDNGGVDVGNDQGTSL